MYAKIDNHIIRLVHNEDTKNIIIYYNYNNNQSCATLIYLNDEKRFLYNYDRYLTKRQQQLLLKLIKKYNIIILKNLFYKMELDKKKHSGVMKNLKNGVNLLTCIKWRCKKWN